MFLAVLFAVSFVFGAGARTLIQLGGIRVAAQSPAAVPPKQDPWYSATFGFERAVQGAVLRVRTAPGNILETFTHASKAYNILYRSTDSRGSASWAVTTFLVPKRAANGAEGPAALLSYQIDYDSADLNASPSYVLSTNSLIHGPEQLIHVADIQTALALGWYVTVPDYEGPLASFALGLQAGYATLDGIRATFSAGVVPTENTTIRTAMSGYSGGALATEWAAELQTEYAPDLNISGIAIGGLVPIVFNVLTACSRGFLAGLGPTGVVGVISQYPKVSDYIVSRLKSNGSHNAAKFMSVKNMTLDESLFNFAFQNVFDYFIGGFEDLENPIFKNVTDDQGRMGHHGTPVVPMFVYKAIHDEVSDIRETDELVEKYCAAGVHIEYERNRLGTHVSEQYTADARAFAFLTEVLEGTYNPPADCIIRNVTLI